MESLPSDRAPKNGAQRTIQSFFLFPAFSGHIRPTPANPTLFPTPCLPLLARPVLGHTVKDPLFEATKKPTGWVALLQHRDRLPVSRPPSLVAAREAIAPNHHPSIHFVPFFENFFNRGIETPFRARRWLPY
jgi:hypothetical protein